MEIREKYWFRARVLDNNPMINPDDGWVQGFYYQDLCGGEMKHFIRSGEMIWMITPETIGIFTGIYDNSEEPKPIFEGDILHMEFADGGKGCYLVGWNSKRACFGIINVIFGSEKDEFSFELWEQVRWKAKAFIIGNIHDYNKHNQQEHGEK